MGRKRVATVKLNEDELTAVVFALSDVLERNDKRFAKSDVWQEARTEFAALARRLDLVALDAGWFNRLNAPTRQAIYDDA